MSEKMTVVARSLRQRLSILRGDLAKAKKALRDSRDQFKELVNNLFDGVYMLDAKGRFTFANKSLLKVLRMRSNEILGMHYRSLLPPKNMSYRKAFRQVLTGRMSDSNEGVARTIDGRNLVYRAHRQPVRRDGKIVGVLGIHSDITHRRQTEEALESTERQLQRLKDANIIGVLFGQGTKITEANDHFLDMIGYTRRDLAAGRIDWKKMTPPEHVPQDRIMIRDMFTSGVARPTEKEYFRRDGGRVPVLLGGAVLSLNPFRWICFALDLTEMKKTQKALQHAHDMLEERVRERTSALAAVNRQLREEIEHRRRTQEALERSESRYRTLVESMREAILTVDTKGAYLFMNTTAAKSFGGRPKDFTGKTLWDMFPRKIADKYAGELRKVIRTRQEMAFDSLVMLQGQPRWFYVTLDPIQNTRGKVTAVMIVARDKTRQKATEEALQSARRRLVNSQDQERRRLSRELHDSVGQKLLAADLRLNRLREAMSKKLGKAHEQALLQLSSEYRELSNEIRAISRALYPPTLEAIGLPASLRQLQTNQHAGECRIIVSSPRSMERMRFSPETEIAFYRIAQEALSNAIRHGKSGRVQISLGYSGGRLRLSIVDDGKGFSFEHRNNKGLGLISMRERAESIDADLTLSSRPGRTAVVVQAGVEALARK
jgi:PAS domain S-box-containing protein